MLFQKPVLEDGEVPVTLEDALNNTRVLTAIFESAKRGGWVEINNKRAGLIYPEQFETKIGFDRIRELVKSHCLFDPGGSGWMRWLS